MYMQAVPTGGGIRSGCEFLQAISLAMQLFIDQVSIGTISGV